MNGESAPKKEEENKNMMTEDRLGLYPSQMKTTQLSCMLIPHIDCFSLTPFHLQLWSNSMKSVKVIKVWRGSSPSHPQPTDSVQTDIKPACAK